jgi:AcrR family transcriptional regulator
MADQVGLARLTLVALAERLGVRQPSLYKHIRSTDGLRRSIALRAKNELADVLARATVGRAGDQAIMSMAHAYRAWALEHPGRYAAAQTAPAPEDADDEVASSNLMRVILDVIAGYQFPEENAIDAIRTMRAALHGFVTLEMEGGFGLPIEVEHSFGHLVDSLTMVLSNWNEISLAAMQV